MKAEYKRVHKLSKKIVGKDSLKRIKKVTDINERTEGLKYLVASKFKARQLELEHQASQKKSRALALDAKLELLPKKIQVLETSHQKRDYESVLKLIKEIEVEIKQCLDS